MALVWWVLESKHTMLGSRAGLGVLGSRAGLTVLALEPAPVCWVPQLS